jgi:hypothetical protein
MTIFSTPRYKIFFAVTEKISDLSSIYFHAKTILFCDYLFLAYFSLWSVIHSNHARYIISWTITLSGSPDTGPDKESIENALYSMYIYLLMFTKSLRLHVKHFIALTKRESVKRFFFFCNYGEPDRVIQMIVKTVSNTNSPLFCLSVIYIQKSLKRW